MIIMNLLLREKKEKIVMIKPLFLDKRKNKFDPLNKSTKQLIISQKISYKLIVYPTVTILKQLIIF